MGVFAFNSKIGGGRNQSIIDIVGNHVNDGALVVVEITGIGIQGVDGKIVVVEAAPAPVEIELAVTLAIAATHKGMSRLSFST